MKDTIVIVTCIRDQWNLEMLCKSIKKHLEPCNLFIIYNDKEDSYNDWFDFFTKRCARYLGNYKVTLKTQRDYWSELEESHLHELQKEGWVDQQVLKIVVSKHVKSKFYLCLDSKNFFIRPCSVKDIAQIDPAPITWVEPILENWVKFCCKTLDLKYPGRSLKLTQNTTPYVIDTEQARALYNHFGGVKKFYVWFTDVARPDHIGPSEFFLYELWCKKQGIIKPPTGVKQNCCSMWGFQIEELGWNEIDFIRYFVTNIKSFDCRVAGIHKTVNGLLSESQIRKILARTGNADLLT